jgi:hypothetical protein
MPQRLPRALWPVLSFNLKGFLIDSRLTMLLEMHPQIIAAEWGPAQLRAATFDQKVFRVMKLIDGDLSPTERLSAAGVRHALGGPV